MLSESKHTITPLSYPTFYPHLQLFEEPKEAKAGRLLVTPGREVGSEGVQSQQGPSPPALAFLEE